MQDQSFYKNIKILEGSFEIENIKLSAEFKHKLFLMSQGVFSSNDLIGSIKAKYGG